MWDNLRDLSLSTLSTHAGRNPHRRVQKSTLSDEAITELTMPQNDIATANDSRGDKSTACSADGSNAPKLSLAGRFLQTRNPSSSNEHMEVLPLIPNRTRPKYGSDTPPKRFIMPQGLHSSHEHRLEPRLHQDSWLDSWRKLFTKRAISEKGFAVKSSATLVEKYGKCREVVGIGASGIVRVSHKMEKGKGEKLYAVKEFRQRPHETKDTYSSRVTTGFYLSNELRHPNVIQLLDLLKDMNGDFYEVMEFCPGGDLFTLVLSAGKLEVQEADCFFKQLMRGIQYIHEMGVTHRDVKPENLLLSRQGRLKISDFGSSQCFRMAWEKDYRMVSGVRGSGPYMAPEVYIDNEFDGRAIDVWACGIVYMAMRTGRHLWHKARRDVDELYAQYLDDRRLEEGFASIESLRRECCRNTIYAMLDPNPCRRITAPQTLRSEWGREIILCREAV